MLGKQLTIIVVLIVSGLQAFSQEGNWSVGVNVYTIAPGVTVSKTIIQDKLYGNFSTNYIKIPFPQYVVKDLGIPDTVQAVGDFNLGRVAVNCGYMLTPKLAFVVGGQYNIYSSNVNLSMTKDYQYETDLNGFLSTPTTIPISKESIGTLNVKTDAKKIAFTTGISYGYFIPKSKWNVRAELGALFQGTLTTVVENKTLSVTALGYTEEFVLNEDEGVKEIITDYKNYLEKYSVFPYLSLSINYKIL